jgi:hypothetical protein
MGLVPCHGDQSLTSEMDFFIRRANEESHAGIRFEKSEDSRQESSVNGTVFEFSIETKDWTLGPEGYHLRITRDEGVRLVAGTSSGVFQGIQTVLRLIRNDDRRIPCLEIQDHPFKEVRGVHLYLPPADGVEWFLRLCDLLAFYRFNTVYLEVGAAMEYRRHPEINTAWVEFCRKMKTFPGGPEGDDGMRSQMGHFKDSVHIEVGGGAFLDRDMTQYIAEQLHARHLEIIPELQALSHAYWMLQSHPECAEREDDPFPDTWCPSREDVYQIYFDCVDEVVEVFRPRSMHIGHDEWYSIGICPRCRSRSGNDILGDDVVRIHDRLASLGIKTVIWHDKLHFYSGKEDDGAANGGMERFQFNRRTRKAEWMRETFRAADRIPQDIRVMAWWLQTGESPKDKEFLDYFQDRGFEIVLGNLDQLQYGIGVPELEEMLRRPNVVGAACSLWHETSDAGFALKDAWVYLLEASRALWSECWSEATRHLDMFEIAALYPAERDRLNGISHPPGLRARTVDLSDVMESLSEDDPDFRFIAEEGMLVGVPEFHLEWTRTPMTCLPRAVRIGSAVRIPCEGTFESICFLHSYSVDLGMVPLHGCTYAGPEKDVIGVYRLVFEDGVIEEVPVAYSRTISFPGRAFNAYHADPAVLRANTTIHTIDSGISTVSVPETSTRMAMYHRVINPRPGGRLLAIEAVRKGERPGEILLFAVTRLE